MRICLSALVHGHVHGDPHAGNIYVIGERAGRLQRAVSPCVVVLDHGLYHQIDDVLRRDLCALFLACINRNRREICRLSHKCAVCFFFNKKNIFPSKLFPIIAL